MSDWQVLHFRFASEAGAARALARFRRVDPDRGLERWISEIGCRPDVVEDGPAGCLVNLAVRDAAEAAALAGHPACLGTAGLNGRRRGGHPPSAPVRRFAHRVTARSVRR